MANKLNISYSIKAIDKFSKTHEKLQKQLEQIKEKTESVIETKPLEISAETDDAMDKLETVQETLDSVKETEMHIEMPKKFLKKFEDLEADMQLLQETDFNIDVNAKDATKTVNTLNKKLNRMRKGIEIDIETNTDDSQEDLASMQNALAQVLEFQSRLGDIENSIDVKFVASTSQFYSKLDKLKADINGISDIEIDTEANAKKALKKVETVSDALGKIEREINIELNSSANKTTREIEGLSQALSVVQERVTNLSRTKAQVELEIDSKGFLQEAEEAEQAIEGIPSMKTIWLNIKAPIDDINNKLDSLADYFRNVGTVARSVFIAPMTAALPAIVPILASIGGGIGAIGSAFVASGIAAAGFATVAIPALQGIFDAYSAIGKMKAEIANADTAKERAAAIKKLEQYMNGLTQAQKKALDAMKDFSNFFNKFAQQFEEPVLNAFIKAMDAARNILEELRFGIIETSQMVNRLFDAFNKNLEAKDMQKFFGWVNVHAVPIMEDLIKAVGNFIAGFLNMVKGFGPLAKKFSKWFLDMSEKFRNWSKTLENNQAFQNFLDYVKKNGPRVVQLVGNIIEFIVALGIAMAPFAAKVLKVTNAFLEWTTQLILNNKWIGTVIGIVLVLVGVIGSLMTPIFLVMGAFKLLRGAGKAVAGFFMKYLWPAIRGLGGILKSAGGWIVKLGGKFLRFLGPVGAIISTIIQLAQIFGISFSDIWGTVRKYWGKAMAFIGIGSNEMEKDVKNAFTNMEVAAKKCLPDMSKMTKKHFGTMAQTINKDTNLMENDTNSTMFSMNSTFRTGLSKANRTFSGKFDKMTSTVKNDMNDILVNTQKRLGFLQKDFNTSMSGIYSDVSNDFGNIEQKIQETMNQIEKKTGIDLNNMQTDFSKTLNNMDSDVLKNFKNMSGNVEQYMNNIQSDVTSDWNTSEKNASKSARSMESTVSAQFTNQRQAAQAGMNALRSTVISLWNRVTGFLSGINLYDIGLNIINGLVNGVQAMAGSLINAVSGAVGSAISAAENLLGIASPSKVFEQIGRFLGQGFVIGINKMESATRRASEALTAAAIPTKNEYKVDVASARQGYERTRWHNALRGGYDEDETYQSNSTKEKDPLADRPIYLVSPDGRTLAEFVADDVSEINKFEADREGRFE